jgi:tetratricopeptide (TPR) repeat protein
MHAKPVKLFPALFVSALTLWSTLGWVLAAQAQTIGALAGLVTIQERDGQAEVLKVKAATWQRAEVGMVLGPGDRVRTRERSRVTLVWANQSTLRLGGFADVQIDPLPAGQPESSSFTLLSGLLYFLHRERPAEVRIKTRTASAAIRGTEFNLAADDNGTTTLTMIDGVVDLSNDQGPITLHSGEQGRAELGKRPVVVAGIQVINVIQWCLYYPGVLDPDELGLDTVEQQTLAASLAAYRKGDLLEALADYPADFPTASSPARLYRANLLLSVGEVERAQASAGEIAANAAATERQRALAQALRRVISAVKGQPDPAPFAPAADQKALASEWLSQSYYQQSLRKLPEALAAAQRATEISPNFGFAWARVAELEFSFGRTEKASAALEHGLRLAPRNAQALALSGFIRLARNKISEAIAVFDQAIEVDGALGQSWLGRGLARLHENQVEDGQRDLLMAASVEPQRALYRSYLGKAYANLGDTERATKELNLAKQLDRKDPTGWFYSALLNQQENRINSAIRDLEKSQELNNNRSLYRSQLMLDQDQAVRSANLANIYNDAGMVDVSLREAARAVNLDYANYSAHLFLANSYDQMRDPKFVNLRLETAANSEYLIANLLGPVGGGTLNSAISQQEYSHLFESNRLGIVSSTEYFSRGDWVENGAQYGIFDTTSYSIGAFYRSENGDRPNEDLQQRQLLLQVKQQITPQDTVYLEASELEIEAGDLVQYYDNVSPFPNLRTTEKQQPILTLGYHHEWGPGQHTLLMANWLNDELTYSNPIFPTLLGLQAGGVLRSVNGLTTDTQFRNTIEDYSIEPQHIWEQENNRLIVGGRFQTGHFDMSNLQMNALGFERFFNDPVADQNLTADFERWSAYLYDQWRVVEPLWLTAGVAYDRVTYPNNLLAPPISDQTTTTDQVSPKAGFIWVPTSKSVIRFAYSRSLGGASLDQSFRIEPTQVAGFNQAFRSLIPESVTGSIPGAHFDLYALSLEQKIADRTYLGISAELDHSDVARTIGAFMITAQPLPPPPQPGQPPPPPPLPPPPASPSSFGQNLDYDQRSVRFTVDRLVGDLLDVGVRYGLTEAQFNSAYPSIPQNIPGSNFQQSQNLESLLHDIGLVLTFNHPSGFFSQFTGDWYSQTSHGYTPARPVEQLWELNLFAGYHFARRRAEVSVGVLNLAGQDYHLDPLTLYSELPRQRTLLVQFKFSF